ncbi:MAG: hypothetical protein KIH67_000220 [Candidatus Moranbacteria bacterium]|nr:hypothetical protein [Candidatus Moranbacteria bacterium]
MKESFSLLPAPEAPSLESLSKYEKVADTLSAIANEMSEVPVPEETVESWRALLGLLYHADHYIDSITSPEEKRTKIEMLKSALRKSETVHDEFLGEILKQIDELTANFSEEDRRFFLRSLTLLLTTTEAVSASEDVHDASKQVLLEGQVTSRLFLPFLSKEFRESDRYHDFVTLLAKIGRVGNGVDALADLPADYRDSQTQIKPTLYNRAVFLGTVLVQSKNLMQDKNLSRELLRKLFFKSAKAVVEDR